MEIVKIITSIMSFMSFLIILLMFNAFIVSVWIFLYKQNKNTERIRNELTDALIDMYCMNPKLDKSDFTKVNSNGRIEIHYKGEPFDPESHL